MFLYSETSIGDKVTQIIHIESLHSYLILCIYSNHGETIVSILIDLNGFWTYENREVLMAENNSSQDHDDDMWRESMQITGKFIHITWSRIVMNALGVLCKGSMNCRRETHQIIMMMMMCGACSSKTMCDACSSKTMCDACSSKMNGNDSDEGCYINERENIPIMWWYCNRACVLWDDAKKFRTKIFRQELIGEQEFIYSCSLTTFWQWRKHADAAFKGVHTLLVFACARDGVRNFPWRARLSTAFGK